MRKFNFLNTQVGNFIHYLSTFLAGLVVGFVSAWRLALLSVAVIPGIAFAGGLYAYTLTGITSKSRESYANAGVIAEQVKKSRIFIYLFILIDHQLFDVMLSTVVRLALCT